MSPIEFSLTSLINLFTSLNETKLSKTTLSRIQNLAAVRNVGFVKRKEWKFGK